MTSSCIFEFNKNPAAYFSGETITGTITFTNSKEINVREACIIFVGEGNVNWEETLTRTRGHGITTMSTIYYRSYEEYIKYYTTVHRNEVLKAGKYTWTFNKIIPKECPTSLEAQYGKIRYELILKINENNIYKKPLTVIKSMDLNLEPAYKIPVNIEYVKNLCCWPCSGGKMLITLKIPFGAYVPGQMIRYYLDIKNQSISNVESYSLELLKKITFTATSPKITKRSIKTSINCGTSPEKCLCKSDRIIEGALYIPSTPPSTNSTDILFVDYELKVILHLSGCNRNPEITVPIIIGTIPIKESFTNDRIIIVSSSEEPILTEVAKDLAALVKYEDDNDQDNEDFFRVYDIDSPVFEEATHSNTNLIDTNDDEDDVAQNYINDFKPLYPIYKK